MSIFKDTFRKYVRNQISLREELIDIGNTDDNGVRSKRRASKDVKLQDGTNVTIDPGAFFTYSLNKQCVIRMTSLVDYVEPVGLEIGGLEGEQSFNRLKGASLSQNFILQGGILSDFARNTNANEAGDYKRKVRKLDQVRQSFPRPGLKTNLGYGDIAIGADASSDGYGIVPMPGIVDATVRTKSAYGSLREAKVTFEVHNQRQLEIMEMLYMRPGYMVLLEWGWCPYVKSSGADAGSIVNHLRLVENETNNKIYTNDITQQTVFNAINKLKESQDGNYDGLLAIVKNFGFQARDDGGYSCYTELISIGEVMESLKIPNISVFKSGIGGSVNSKIDEVENPIVIQSYGGGNTRNIDEEDFQNALSAGVFPSSNGLLGMIQALNNYATFSAGVLNGYSDLNVVNEDSLINQKLDNVFPDLTEPEEDEDGEDTAFASDTNAAAEAAGYKHFGSHEQKRRAYLLDLLRFQSANIDLFIKNLLKTPTDDELKNYIIFRGNTKISRESGTYKRRNEVQQSYIRWDALTILINESLIPKDQKASTPFSIITDRIYYKNKNEKRFDPLLYCGITAYDKAQSNEIFDFSCDANICILPNQFAVSTTPEGNQFDTLNIEDTLGYIPEVDKIPFDYIAAKYGISDSIKYKGESYTDSTFKLNETDKVRRIGNIFLNLDMLLNIAEKNADNDEYTLGNFINDIWKEVNKACPNHNFVLTDDKESNVGFIIDLPVDNTELPVDDLHEFIPYSNKNILRSFEYTSNVPSAMTSTIAIQAQDPRSIQDIDGVTFAAFNRSIKNRILSTDTRSNFAVAKSQAQSQKSSIKDEQVDLKTRLRIYLMNFFTNLKLLANEEEVVGAGNIMGTLKTYQKNSAYLATAFTNTSTFNSVIPLEFTATIDGIAGIVIGNVFKIQKDRLPKAYAKADIGFIVFNEEQKITAGGDWSTDIGGKMIILPSKNKIPKISGVEVNLEIPEELKDFSLDTATTDAQSESVIGIDQARGTDIGGVMPGMDVYLKRSRLEGLGWNPTRGIFVADSLDPVEVKKLGPMGYATVRSEAFVDSNHRNNARGMFNCYNLPGEISLLKGGYGHPEGAPGAAAVNLGKVKPNPEARFIQTYGENKVKILPQFLHLYVKPKDFDSEYLLKGKKSYIVEYDEVEQNEDGKEYYVVRGGLMRVYTMTWFGDGYERIDISTMPGNKEWLGGYYVYNSTEANDAHGSGQLFDNFSAQKNALKAERRVLKEHTVDEKHIWLNIQFSPDADKYFLNDWSAYKGYIRSVGADDQLPNSTLLSEYSVNNDCWMRDDTLAGSEEFANLPAELLEASDDALADNTTNPTEEPIENYKEINIFKNAAGNFETKVNIIIDGEVGFSANSDSVSNIEDLRTLIDESFE